MAETLTQKNPRLVKSNDPMEKQYVLAADAKTWKAGQPGLYASGVASPVASNGAVVHFVFMADQTTSTSSTYAWVGLVTADMVFEGFELDNALAASMINVPYAVDVTSNILTVDTGDTDNDCVKIIDLASNYEPSRNKSDDVKARCWFRYLTAAIDG